MLSPPLDQIGPLSVWVYFADHRRPHVQIRGPGTRANVDILSGEVLAGELSPKDHRRVLQWLVPRREAVLDAFHAALRHETPDTILTRYREATR